MIAISALLDKQGLSQVAVPGEWTGSGSVDLFTAENFLELLDTAELVEVPRPFRCPNYQETV